jgi:hypothetical protein
MPATGNSHQQSVLAAIRFRCDLRHGEIEEINGLDLHSALLSSLRRARGRDPSLRPRRPSSKLMIQKEVAFSSEEQAKSRQRVSM